MRALRISLFGLALGVLAAGTVWAEEEQAPTFPSSPDWDGNFSQPEVSGVFNPMRITVEDVAYDGQGSATIPFSLNQRGRAWVAIYETGNTETGRTGPFGAWWRFEPQDKFVAMTPDQIFEAGRNTITWDGNDWEGNAAGAGQYEFDLIAVNNIDKPVLAGPGSGTGFGHNRIDTRHDPAEIWCQEADRAGGDGLYGAGDIIRGTMGTDYLANPNAWERWTYNGVLDFEGARTLGGFRPDDASTEIFWTTQHSGEFGGLYKMIINRSARAWDPDESFGDNGFAANKEDRIVGIEPWEPLGIVYAGHDSKGDVPFPTIESWDKTSGEISREFDMSDIYILSRTDDEGNEVVFATGPRNIAVNSLGIWTSTWSSPKIAHVNHDGDLIWMNDNGDFRGDRISNEDAAELGMSGGSVSTNMQMGVRSTGATLFMASYGNERGADFSGYGRDGSGLMDVILPSSIGPFRPETSWYLTIVDDGDGPYDGAYTSGHYYLITREFSAPAEGKRGPGALMYIPLDLETASLGAGATAVEAVESAGTPDSYSLGRAYPNPFNPETTIEFSVPSDGYVEIGVYNAVGQQVASLVDKELSAGNYKTTWDALDRSGQKVSSGVYFYRMQAGDFSATHSMSLLK